MVAVDSPVADEYVVSNQPLAMAAMQGLQGGSMTLLAMIGWLENVAGWLAGWLVGRRATMQEKNATQGEARCAGRQVTNGKKAFSVLEVHSTLRTCRRSLTTSMLTTNKQYAYSTLHRAKLRSQHF